MGATLPGALGNCSALKIGQASSAGECGAINVYLPMGSARVLNETAQARVS